MINNYKLILTSLIRGLVSDDEDLSMRSTFKIGGKPLLWIEPDTDIDLRRALRALYKAGIKPFPIGNGSNILINDGKIEKAFIKLSAPHFRKMVFGKDSVTCGGGISLPVLIRECIERGLAGLEGLAGIPGSVGGAIATNASGAAKKSTGNLVKWIRVMNCDTGETELLKARDIRFDYRKSGLSGKIILEAEFTLTRKGTEAVQRSYDDLLRKKLSVQDYSMPSAGCVFKNNARIKMSAGEILEKCGLKGKRVGGAEVSTKHANFILNRGDAKFKDVISLIKIQQEAVLKDFGIELEPEIEIIK